MKSITQNMRYLQSLMSYAQRYGVSAASRKYNRTRSFIYFWRKRWDGSPESLQYLWLGRVLMGAMILAEIGDFTRFSSPDQILAYAGLSPSTYQSGKLANAYPHMEKRGSRYLRYALFNATKYVCNWDPAFAAYLAKNLNYFVPHFTTR